MAGANTGIYKFKSVVGGHHILNCINSTNYKSLKMVWQDIIECDEYTVTITKGRHIVGLIPREISRICLFS